MTKDQLVREIAAGTGQTHAATNLFLRKLRDTLATALKNGERVEIQQFGSFSLVATKERSGNNPRTGEKITIPAGEKVKFTVSKSLKDELFGAKD
jgi:DNA-binding protein HU-beta